MRPNEGGDGDARPAGLRGGGWDGEGGGGGDGASAQARREGTRENKRDTETVRYVGGTERQKGGNDAGWAGEAR